MKSRRQSEAVIAAVIVIVLVMAIGWVINAAHVFQSTFSPPISGKLVMRVIGVFIPPLGGVLGYVL